MIKKELYTFFAALLFYTRISFIKSSKVTEEHFLKSAKYFPLVGWLVGGISAITYLGSTSFLPNSVAILICMLTSILITGALHEDGFADVCDGFGGGWNKERILTIMKDSQIGTYGVVGLLFVFLFKFLLLYEIFSSHSKFPITQTSYSTILYPLLILIAAHSLSRFVSISFMKTHQYVRVEAESKAKYVTQKMKLSTLLFSLVFGIFPLIFFDASIFLVFIPMLLIKWLLGRYFTKWIGGYTGDCLGATQQICEVTFYLFILIAPWRFI